MIDPAAIPEALQEIIEQLKAKKAMTADREHGYDHLLWSSDVEAALLAAYTRGRLAAPKMTVVYVEGHDGKTVAAPCCLSGCQYDEALERGRLAHAQAVQQVFPIPLNAEQEAEIKLWAADDRLWTTQETVEFNLRTFARKILAEADPRPPVEGATT